MSSLVTRHASRLLPWVALPLGPLIGGLIVWQPLLAFLLLALALLVFGMARLVDADSMRRLAFALCWLVITYPALLPRRAFVLEGATIVSSRGLDERTRLQLLILVGILAASVWMMLSLRSSIAMLLRPPFSWLAVYCLLISMSMVYTPDRVWAAGAALRLFEVVLLLTCTAALVTTARHVRQMLDVMLWGSALVAGAYVLEIMLGTAVVDSSDRYRTSWIHPNNASIVAYTFAATLAARFFCARSLRETTISGMLACLGVGAGLLIGGKTALAAGALAIMVVSAVAVWRQGIQRNIGRLLLIVLGVGLATVMIVVADVGIVAHLQDYQQNAYIDPSNLTGRVPVWTAVIRTGMERPLLGYGYMSTFEGGIDNGLGWLAPQAHNSFLQTFHDLGLVGLVPVVLIFVGTWVWVLRPLRHCAANDPRWMMALQLLGALIVLTLESFVEDTFGGIFEIRTMLFLMVVTLSFLNTHLASAEAQRSEARPEHTRVMTGMVPDRKSHLAHKV